MFNMMPNFTTEILFQYHFQSFLENQILLKKIVLLIILLDYLFVVSNKIATKMLNNQITINTFGKIYPNLLVMNSLMG